MIYSRALKHCTTTKCIFFSEMQFFFTRKMKIVEKSKYPHSIQVSADSFAQVSGIRRQLCPGIRYPQTAFPKYPQSIQVSMCHPGPRVQHDPRAQGWGPLAADRQWVRDGAVRFTQGGVSPY